MKTILYVSHKKSQCGVYMPSLYATNALQHSKRYRFIRVECESLEELKAFIDIYSPSAIIYNYMPILFPWMGNGLYRLDPIFTGIVQILSLIHI